MITIETGSRWLFALSLSLASVGCGGSDDKTTTPDGGGTTIIDPPPEPGADASAARTDALSVPRADGMTPPRADAAAGIDTMTPVLVRHDAAADSRQPTPTAPTQLSISADFGTVRPIQTTSSDGTKVFSSLSVTAQPKFMPALPLTLNAPNLTKAARFTVEEPPAGGCTATPQFTLNKTEISFMILGTDVLPSTACADHVKRITQRGIRVSFADVPYGNGPVAHQVTVSLTP